MICEKLLPELKAKFGHLGLIEGKSPDPMVRIPAAHPNVGDIIIYDDGDEATVVIEEITHGHFNPYDESLSEEERDIRITEDVVEFLEELFDDKILLWRNQTGSIGGWKNLLYTEGPLKPKKGYSYYVWSGPYAING